MTRRTTFEDFPTYTFSIFTIAYSTFLSSSIRSVPAFLLLAVPRRLFCFGFVVILDVARCYLWLFTLYINIKIGKNSC